MWMQYARVGESLNITYIAVYVLQCQLPNSKALRGAVCSLSLLASGHADAWPAWHNCTQASSFWCISPELRFELQLRRAWCIASSQAPTHRMVQPVRPHRRPGDT